MKVIVLQTNHHQSTHIVKCLSVNNDNCHWLSLRSPSGRCYKISWNVIYSRFWFDSIFSQRSNILSKHRAHVQPLYTSSKFILSQFAYFSSWASASAGNRSKLIHCDTDLLGSIWSLLAIDEHERIWLDFGTLHWFEQYFSGSSHQHVLEIMQCRILEQEFVQEMISRLSLLRIERTLKRFAQESLKTRHKQTKCFQFSFFFVYSASLVSEMFWSWAHERDVRFLISEV